MFLHFETTVIIILKTTFISLHVDKFALLLDLELLALRIQIQYLNPLSETELPKHVRLQVELRQLKH